jgi:hypothetical protein
MKQHPYYKIKRRKPTAYDFAVVGVSIFILTCVEVLVIVLALGGTP